MTCPICICNFNKSTCAEVKCTACEYSSCKTCTRTYLLNTTQTSHCMNCRVKWTQEFTKSAIGATYYNKEYRAHKSKQLMDQVIAKREEYMLEAIKYRDDMEDNKAIADLIVESHKINKDKYIRTDVQDMIEDIKNKIRIRHGLEPEYRNPFRAIIYNRANRDVAPPKKPGFIMPCQSSECNGMLDESYYCHACYKTTCSKCLDIQDINHCCNPDSIASAKALKKDSKPCPKCGCRISKIDGCDQMWCIVCQTAFSWNTGAIENGNIHNPHYFQYMREQKEQEAKRKELDNKQVEEEAREHLECGKHRIAAETWMFRRANWNVKSETDAFEFMIEYLRYANHVSEVSVKQYEKKIELNQKSNNEYIYKWLLNKINKEELESKLYLHNKANEKYQSFLDVYNAIGLVVDDICIDIARGNRNVIELYKTFKKYSAYFNIELLKIVRLYETKSGIDMFMNKLVNKQYEVKSMIDDEIKHISIAASRA